MYVCISVFVPYDGYVRVPVHLGKCIIIFHHHSFCIFVCVQFNRCTCSMNNISLYDSANQMNRLASVRLVCKELNFLLASLCHDHHRLTT